MPNMDTLSHYLWAVIIYWYLQKPRKWLLGLSGALPDLLSFGLLFVMVFFTGTFEPGGPPSLESIPAFIFTLYDITHSLIPIGLVTLGLWIWKRKYVYLTFGWIFHILCDIPTHTREYFPTPFLWPISSFTINGFSWGQPWFMALNYGAIIICFILLANREKISEMFFKRKRS